MSEYPVSNEQDDIYNLTTKKLLHGAEHTGVLADLPILRIR